MSPDASIPALTVTGGPHDGQSLALPQGATLVVGSADAASLRLSLANVSPEHVRVSHTPGQPVVLTDLRSVAGTYVNGERVEGERALKEGDRICLGPPGAKASVKLLLVRTTLASEEPAILLDGAEDGIALDASAQAPAFILDDSALEAPAPSAPKEAPAPAAPEPPSAVLEPPPPPPTPAPALRARAEYTDAVPSIVSTMQRQPLPVPPPPPDRLPQRRKPAPPKVPLSAALAVVGAVVLLGGGYFAISRFTKGPPVASSVLPPRVEGGQTVTVSGSGFGSDPAAVTVRVGETPGTIVSAADTQVAVQVPDVDPENGAAELPVVVETSGGRSQTLTLTVTAPPRIAGLEPDVAMPGSEVVASGKHLKGKPLAVSVDGQDAEVLEAAGDRLRFRVPELSFVPGRAAAVVVRLGREVSKPASLYLGRLPLLTDASPARASSGERVVLKGRGFSPLPEANLVRFGSETALVLQARPEELIVSTPGAGVITTQMEAPIQVETEKGRSNPLMFMITRLSAGQFVPRYFAAPVLERPGTVVVATELGPALVLGGPGEARSAAERAVKLASALNALAEEASRKPVALEARDNVVGVVTGATLATVTADDLAAYEALSPDKGRRASATLVASLWASLLQDQLDLFVRRQRPVRLVQVTPRGRAIMQLYREALRRAGVGAGVPLSVVSPLSSSLARELREMALAHPAPGAGSSAAAMEGRWRGTMWEEGAGEKPIVVRLKADGAKLSGILTTSSGEISGDTPIEDASFEKGQLRFTVNVRGARQRFEGSVDGEKVSGSISHAGSAGAVGRFTLTIVE